MNEHFATVEAIGSEPVMTMHGPDERMVYPDPPPENGLFWQLMRQMNLKPSVMMDVVGLTPIEFYGLKNGATRFASEKDFRWAIEQLVALVEKRTWP